MADEQPVEHVDSVAKTVVTTSGPVKPVGVDPELKLLFAGMFIFAAMLFVAEERYRSDGQMFQAISSLLAGFSGAFFAKITTKDKKP